MNKKAINRIRPVKDCVGADWMTTGQIATRLGVSARLVAKWIDTGQLVGFKVPYSTHRRVHRQMLEEFENRHGFNRARGK